MRNVRFDMNSKPDFQLWADMLEVRNTADAGMPEEHTVVVRCRSEAEATECSDFLRQLFGNIATTNTENNTKGHKQMADRQTPGPKGNVRDDKTLGGVRK